MTKSPAALPTFTEVSDRLRVAHRGSVSMYKPQVDQLIAGKTLQVSWPQKKASGVFCALLRSQGFRLHTYSTPEGTVMWAEKRKEAG